MPLHVRRIKDAAADTVREIDHVVDREYAAIFRDHPFFEPAEEIDWVRRIIDREDVRAALRLN